MKNVVRWAMDHWDTMQKPLGFSGLSTKEEHEDAINLIPTDEKQPLTALVVSGIFYLSERPAARPRLHFVKRLKQTSLLFNTVG